MYDYHDDLRTILDNIGTSKQELKQGKIILAASMRLLLQKDLDQPAKVHPSLQQLTTEDDQPKPSAEDIIRQGVLGKRDVAINSGISTAVKAQPSLLPSKMRMKVIERLEEIHWEASNLLHDGMISPSQRFLNRLVALEEQTDKYYRGLNAGQQSWAQPIEKRLQAQLKLFKQILMIQLAQRPLITQTVEKHYGVKRQLGLNLLKAGISEKTDVDSEFESLIDTVKQDQARLNPPVQKATQIEFERLVDQLTNMKQLAHENHTQYFDLMQGIHDVAAQQMMHSQDSEAVKAAWDKLADVAALNVATASTIENLLDHWPAPVATPKPSPTLSVDSPKVHSSAEPVYTVRRLRAGVNLIDQTGKVVAFVDEKTTRQRQMTAGDLVKAQVSNGNARIEQIVGHQDLDAHKPVIQTAPFMLVESPDRTGKLIICHDINLKPLVVDGKPMTWELDPELVRYFNLRKGSVVELAWYQDPKIVDRDYDGRLMIRWVYDTKTTPKVLPADNHATSNNKRIRERKNLADDPRLGLKTNLALDLQGQHVGIYVGNRQNKVIVEEIVRAYHGRPRVLDGFSKNSRKIKRQVKNLDMVILVLALASHEVSQPLVRVIKQEGIKFAVSTSLSKRQIAQALYRAEHGLPVFEPANQAVDYPTVLVGDAD